MTIFSGHMAPSYRGGGVPHLGPCRVWAPQINFSIEANAMELTRNATDTKNFVSYFRVTPDNRLLFGGRARFAKSTARSDVKSGTILRQSMIEVFPNMADVRIDYCWGGMVDMTACSIPWDIAAMVRRCRRIWARSWRTS